MKIFEFCLGVIIVGTLGALAMSVIFPAILMLIGVFGLLVR